MMLSRRIFLRRTSEAGLLVPGLAAGAALFHALPSAEAASDPVLAAVRRHAEEARRQDARRDLPKKDDKSGPKPLLVLDPGHGGHDPGAIGVGGAFEKQITLATALELKRVLEAEGKYRVMLTRTRDVFIPLEDRAGLAQRHQAALFVSMHADAMANHAVRGASVYTLADTASDAQSAALAVRENAANRGYKGPSAPPEVAKILASLVRRETRAGSARIQRGLVSSLGQDLPLLPNPARHAAFAVLRAPDVPSVLLEMGFLSNQQDETALRRPEHRRLVARGMKRAIDSWFAMRAAPAGLVG